MHIVTQSSERVECTGSGNCLAASGRREITLSCIYGVKVQWLFFLFSFVFMYLDLLFFSPSVEYCFHRLV